MHQPGASPERDDDAVPGTSAICDCSTVGHIVLAFPHCRR
jgi:hypothetical protein